MDPSESIVEGKAKAEDARVAATTEKVENAGPVPESPSDAGAAPDIAPEFEGALSFRSSGGRNDGAVEVFLQENKMSATAVFIPPVGEGSPVDADYVRNLIESLGVISGVQWPTIEESILRCNLERHVLRDVVIAQGTEPEDEVPEHAELAEKFQNRPKTGPANAHRIDYRELSSLIVVKKGETLARIFPRIQGKPGLDLFGRESPFSKRAVANYRPGKNVIKNEDRLEAAEDGLLSISVAMEGSSTLEVEEILVVKGEVDYHTGHIIFPGDVVIDGTVRDGFKVYSGGTIACKSTLDAFDINAKADLLCAQGIIGRRRGQIRVGGELHAKFVQNCRVAVRGDAHILTAIVGCRFYCLGKLDLGDRGVLMGGESYAVHGLYCGRLGNQARQRTIIHVGTDFTIQQQLDQANERLRVLSFKAQQLEALAASGPDAKRARIKAEVAHAISETQSHIMKLLGGLDADEGAVVEVRGEVFPGTEIEICRVSFRIEEPLRSCRFRLDKVAGKLIVERLGTAKVEATTPNRAEATHAAAGRTSSAALRPASSSPDAAGTAAIAGATGVGAEASATASLRAEAKPNASTVARAKADTGAGVRSAALDGSAKPASGAGVNRSGVR